MYRTFTSTFSCKPVQDALFMIDTKAFKTTDRVASIKIFQTDHAFIQRICFFSGRLYITILFGRCTCSRDPENSAAFKQLVMWSSLSSSVINTSNWRLHTGQVCILGGMVPFCCSLWLPLLKRVLLLGLDLCDNGVPVFGKDSLLSVWEFVVSLLFLLVFSVLSSTDLYCWSMVLI